MDTKLKLYLIITSNEGPEGAVVYLTLQPFLVVSYLIILYLFGVHALLIVNVKKLDVKIELLMKIVILEIMRLIMFARYICTQRERIRDILNVNTFVIKLFCPFKTTEWNSILSKNRKSRICLMCESFVRKNRNA